MISEFSPRAAQARAPAILDVMGDISDTSGGLCLSTPLSIATDCRVTPRDAPGVGARFNESARLEITRGNSSHGGPGWAQTVAKTLDKLPDDVVLPGLELEIVSDIPQDAGLGDQIALEIAVLSATIGALNLSLNPTQIAGSTAALATSLARANHLSQIRCQPALVGSYLELPEGLALWAIDSGVAQNAGQSAYDIAICAMEMGAALLREIVPGEMRGPDGALYLANVSTDVWRALRLKIPEKLSGAQFLEARETVPNLENDRIYNVRLATEHPIYEADRTARFTRLLRAINENPDARTELGRAAGELMIQSHFSYDHRCNLSSPETDLLVSLAREAGVKNGIYGARISGRGAGGAVVVLADRQINADLDAQIGEIVATYAGQSGRTPQSFRGSSGGANVNVPSFPAPPPPTASPGGSSNRRELA